MAIEKVKGLLLSCDAKNCSGRMTVLKPDDGKMAGWSRVETAAYRAWLCPGHAVAVEIDETRAEPGF